jgi:hypothetical protein
MSPVGAICFNEICIKGRLELREGARGRDKFYREGRTYQNYWYRIFYYFCSPNIIWSINPAYSGQNCLSPSPPVGGYGGQRRRFEPTERSEGAREARFIGTSNPPPMSSLNCFLKFFK